MGSCWIKNERNIIIVALSFSIINVNSIEKVSDKVYHKVTNKTEDTIVNIIRDNPNITVNQLMIKTSLSEPGVKKNLKQLKEKKLKPRAIW